MEIVNFWCSLLRLSQNLVMIFFVMIFFITKKIITDFILFPSAEILFRSKKLLDNHNPSHSGLVSGTIRNRIAHVAYYEEFTTASNELTQEYDYATHYIYDIHGNVKTLIQDNEYIHASQRYKRLDYEYDLISGRVNEVIYQPDAIDQYIHRYAYDPDNRITNVFTSKDGVIWEQDAKYFYYDHGPLARTEIGDRKVQGIDHAYTINGWLKGVNSNMLNASSDIGNDGKEAEVNGLIAKDEFGYSLGYFEGDYTPRTAAELLPSNNFLLDHHYERSLYNGNITHMSTSIAAFMFGEGEEAEPSTFEYKYDQLNRIIEARHRDWTIANVPGLTDDRWLTSYNFDLNGNILNLNRHDSQGAQFDDLEYTYGYRIDNDAISNSVVVAMEENNRLMHVDDIVSTTINTDILDQDPFNYTYDNIGNLIADDKEQIENIEWTVTGKIKSISRTTNSILPDLAFLYDPMGQRIAKIVKDRTGGTPSDRSHWRTTWYVRDASGNVMSTYEEETEENSEAECPAGTYDYTTTIAWTEAHIYGSSRVGMETQSAVTSRFGVNYDSNDLPTYAASNCISYAAIAVYTKKYGDKRFELSNHLGNVLVVVSDLLIANTGTTLSYSSEVISATDYYPYGMVMDERHYVSEGLEYRYGFNGKELDNPGMGGGQSTYDYGFRIYNPAIAKFLSVDPLTKEYPWYTPYQFAGNKPIWKIDLDGLEESDSRANDADDSVENEVGITPPPVTGKEVQGDYSEDGNFVFLEGGDKNKKDGLWGVWAPVPTWDELEKSKNEICELIDASCEATPQASFNLNHWMNGTGQMHSPSKDWLLSVPKVNFAISQNLTRFENQLNSKGLSLSTIASELKDGEVREHRDYYESTFRYNATYYAYGPASDLGIEKDFAFGYGSATIKSEGVFELKRSGNTVLVKGNVQHTFIDRYDWEIGLSVDLNGRKISDVGMKLIEVYYNARPFEIRTVWNDEYTKIFTP